MSKHKSDLCDAGMEILYPPRTIISYYFDTANMQMFCDSEEGTLPRKKVRYRRYGQSKKFTKEIKISSIEGRFKTTEICDISLNDNAVLNNKILDKDYGIITPLLKVMYRRSIFRTSVYVLH